MRLKSFRFGGRGLDVFFQAVRIFSAAVEEVGDVGVFFGLGDVGLADTLGLEHVGEGVFCVFWREGDSYWQPLFVLGHGDYF